MSALNAADLDRFFHALARRISFPARVIVTGGCEALLLGGARATGDLDFGVVLGKPHQGRWAELETAIGAAATETRITIQYSTDIDRWSPISVPQRARRTVPFRRIERLTIDLLASEVRAVYKLARYLESDVADLVAVLNRQNVSSIALVRLCGVSLRASPRSPALTLFRYQVEHFFDAYGRDLWGAKFAPEKSIRIFHVAAGMKRSTR